MALLEAPERSTEDRQAAAAVIAALAARYGNRLATSQALREQHGHTTTWIENQPPDAVVFPQSTEEVQEIVRLCAAHRVPVIGFGQGTSLEGQVNAPRGGICLDFRDLNRVLAVHAEDLDCVIEPGITRKQLNENLRDTGLFFPIDPGADASLGGMAATRASGTNAVRYGTMKDNVLALKAVLANGEVISTGHRAKKSSAGYDLARLMIGSEGTLGIITELTLRLAGIPESISSGVCPFPSVEAACNATILTIQTGIPVARIELLDEMQVKACNAYSKLTLPETPMLFLEFHGSEASVAEQSQRFGEIAAELGGGPFDWAIKAEDRRRVRADLALGRMCHPIAARFASEPAGRAGRRPCRRRQFPYAASDRPQRCRRDRPRQGFSRTPGRSRAGDGRHLHRRARHRPGQDAIYAGRAWRADARRHARDQARARSA